MEAARWLSATLGHTGRCQLAGTEHGPHAGCAKVPTMVQMIHKNQERCTKIWSMLMFWDEDGELSVAQSCCTPPKTGGRPSGGKMAKKKRDFFPYFSISRPDAHHANTVKIFFLPVDPLQILVPVVLGIILKTFWQITSPTDDCFGADFPMHLELVQVWWGPRKVSLFLTCSAGALGASQPCHPITLTSHHIWAQLGTSLYCVFKLDGTAGPHLPGGTWTSGAASTAWSHLVREDEGR